MVNEDSWLSYKLIEKSADSNEYEFGSPLHNSREK